MIQHFKTKQRSEVPFQEFDWKSKHIRVMLVTRSEISHGPAFLSDNTENYNRSSNKRLLNNLKNILYPFKSDLKKNSVWRKRSRNIDLHWRDFTRFWLNKYI